MVFQQNKSNNLNIFTKPLTIIINQMLKTGIFPDQLKIAKVMPIHKKDDEIHFTNYRPISLLPSISNFLRKSFLINSLSISKLIIYFILHNIV